MRELASAKRCTNSSRLFNRSFSVNPSFRISRHDTPCPNHMVVLSPKRVYVDLYYFLLIFSTFQSILLGKPLLWDFETWCSLSQPHGGAVSKKSLKRPLIFSSNILDFSNRSFSVNPSFGISRHSAPCSNHMVVLSPEKV
jgi:hypothetical protein